MDMLRLNPALLTPEHLAFRDTVRRFVARELEPHAGRWDEAGEFPRELYAKAAEAGLLALGFPEEYGGTAEADPPNGRDDIPRRGFLAFWVRTNYS